MFLIPFCPTRTSRKKGERKEWKENGKAEYNKEHTNDGSCTQ